MTDTIETGLNLSALADRLESVLLAAGRLAMDYFHKGVSASVEQKTHGDFVTKADREVEQQIRQQLEALDQHFLVVGEEYGGEPKGSYWLVDPIDGTSNFISGLPFWCISIALVRDDTPVLGGIYAPALGILMVGGVDVGLRSKGISTRAKSINARCFGIGRNGNWPCSERQELEKEIESAGFNVVTLGSCALSLMYVASGNLRGFRENHCSGAWDCAGGVVLCNAAGISANYTANADGTINVNSGQQFDDGVYPA